MATNTGTANNLNVKHPAGDPTATGTNGMANNGTRGGGGLHQSITPGGHELDRSQAPFADYHRRLANPAPLGLISFATTTFILSIYNARTRGITVPNVVVGSALAYGGLCQLLAGMWEFAQGNTFGATAFTSYGGFWISYAIIQWPSSGVISAYSSRSMLADALGIFLFAWFIVTFIFLIASLRSSMALVVLFFLLDITFLLLAIGEMLGKSGVTKAGGIFGILTAFVAFYTGASGLMTRSTSHFLLPVGDLNRERAVRKD